MLADIVAYKYRKESVWAEWPYPAFVKPSGLALRVRYNKLSIIIVCSYHGPAKVHVNLYGLKLSNGSEWDSMNGFHGGGNPDSAVLQKQPRVADMVWRDKSVFRWEASIRTIARRIARDGDRPISWRSTLSTAMWLARKTTLRHALSYTMHQQFGRYRRKIWVEGHVYEDVETVISSREPK